MALFPLQLAVSSRARELRPGPLGTRVSPCSRMYARSGILTPRRPANAPMRKEGSYSTGKSHDGAQDACAVWHPGPACQRTRPLIPARVRQLLEAVRASGATGELSDKALKQLVLPFARARMAEAVEGGPQVRGAAVAAGFCVDGLASTWVPSRAGGGAHPFRPIMRQRRTKWRRTHVALSYAPAADGMASREADSYPTSTPSL